jgi:peptide/nickel transport system substrate-binding protein
LWGKLAAAAVCAAIAMTCAMGLSACSGSSSSSSSNASSAAAESADTLSVAWNSNTGDYSLDPTNNYMAWQGSYLGIYENLYRINGDFQVDPWLATDAQQTSDTTWVFTIRDGVTFQNGKAVDGAAVKASLENAIAKNKRAATTSNIASIEADGQKVTITTSTPVPMLPSELSEPVFSIIDVNSGTADNMPVGTGPYKMDSEDESGNVELSAYDGYWQGTPQVKTVHARYINDATAKENALKSGEVQGIMGIPNDSVSTYANDPSYSVYSTNKARMHMLFFNTKSPVTSDPAVREALSMLVDRDTLADTLYAGQAKAAHAVFPDNSEYSKGVEEVTYNRYQAAKILADAGWKDTDGDGILDKDGQKLSVHMVTYAANAELPKMCEALSSEFSKVGIASDVEVAEKISNRLGESDWEIGTMAFSVLPTGNPYTHLAAVMGTDGNYNFGKYSNAQVDETLAKMSTTSDQSEIATLAQQAQKQAFSDHAYLYVEETMVNDVTSSKVHDLYMRGQYDWLNYQVTVDK